MGNSIWKNASKYLGTVENWQGFELAKLIKFFFQMLGFNKRMSLPSTFSYKFWILCLFQLKHGPQASDSFILNSLKGYLLAAIRCSKNLLGPLQRCFPDFFLQKLHGPGTQRVSGVLRHYSVKILIKKKILMYILN